MAEQVTAEQARAAVSIVAAVAETIRELKEVPSGVLYANLMGRVNFEQYQSIIGVLKRAELVSEENNVLRWVGPVIP